MTGAWFANIILIIFYLQGTKKSSSETLTYNLVIILISVALLLTESTGAFIALIDGIFIYYITSRNKNKKGNNSSMYNSRNIIIIICICSK